MGRDFIPSASRGASRWILMERRGQNVSIKWARESEKDKQKR